MLAFTLVIVFIASSGLVLGTYVFTTRRRLAREEAARRRLREPVGQRTDSRLKRHESVSAIPVVDEWLRKAPAALSLSQTLKASGSTISPATLILMGPVLAVAGVYIGQMQRNVLLSIGLGLFGLAAPYFYLRWKQRQRMVKFESQLPDAIDMVVNALRAGYAFQGAMELVGKEMQ
ncbi:MAG: hypothetical protein R3282_06620, partial [Rhodothermales bacterium]|nr:hypothetical protein [Rhodothermales bacterium]